MRYPLYGNKLQVCGNCDLYMDGECHSPVILRYKAMRYGLVAKRLIPKDIGVWSPESVACETYFRREPKQHSFLAL